MRNKVTCNPCSGRKKEGNPSELSENTLFQGRPRNSWPLDNDWLTMMRGGGAPLSLPPDNGGGRGGLSLAGRVLVWEHGLESSLEGSGGHQRKRAQEEEREARLRQRAPSESQDPSHHGSATQTERPATGEGTRLRSPLDRTWKSQLPSLLLCISYLSGYSRFQRHATDGGCVWM